MRFVPHSLTLACILLRPSFALLEDAFVSFTPSNGTLNIVGATILVAADDFVGVHIAARSLASDLEQITGAKPDLRNVTGNSTQPGNSNFALKAAIITGSVNSSLIRQLSANDVIDVSELKGWETFKTSVVVNPLPGVDKALVIAGSDKRGTIFGIHTLAEQSGQSPYDSEP